MKQYKLIKKYPNSPKLGTIASFDKNQSYCYYQEEENHLIDNSEIEFYPEHWQEVNEIPWKILSFIDNNSSISHCDIETNMYVENGNSFYNSLAFMLNSKNERIYSIKRLSDGEIFTIGDRVKQNETHSDVITIDLIKIDEGSPSNILFYQNNPNTGFSFNYFCDTIVKCGKKLFTTEDGVDIFMGDSYVILDNNFQIYESLHAGIGSGVPLDLKYFSTKESAEEYIIENKPCLSFNDIKQEFIMSWQENKLKKLIKSKL